MEMDGIQQMQHKSKMATEQYEETQYAEKVQYLVSCENRTENSYGSAKCEL